MTDLSQAQRLALEALAAAEGGALPIALAGAPRTRGALQQLGYADAQGEGDTRVLAITPLGRSQVAPAAAAPVAGASGAASKTETLRGLLCREGGATIGEMQAATGWQPHSVRGFIAGALKKKLGLAATSAKTERGRVYSVVQGAQA